MLSPGSSPPNHRNIDISWRPPLTYLHYNELYCGIYEYLRAPPDPQFRESAVEYLMDLQQNSVMYNLIPKIRRLQTDRIMWVLEWLKAMPECPEVSSDADTVEHNEMP